MPEPKLTLLDPEAFWWVCWRIDGDLCAHSLLPIKTAATIDVIEKVGALYGKNNVWLERADEGT